MYNRDLLRDISINRLCVKNELKYCLSDKDLQKIYPGNFIIYNDIDKYYNNIDEMFLNNICYILFEMDQKLRGHYCVLLKRGNIIEFFDPYGYKIEQQKEFMNDDLLERENHISKMLIDSKYSVSYNHYEFQELNSNISTCGRWCGLRAMFRDLPLFRFKNMVVKECKRLKVDPDTWTVLMTEKLL